MPLYMDIHTVPGATPEALKQAHDADVAVQNKHHVCYRKYWFNEQAGKVFCLVEAPNAEAAAAVHREAHGLVAEKIIEVDPDMADGMLGPGVVSMAGAVMMPEDLDRRDNGIRSIMFTDIVGSTEMTSRHGDDAAIASTDGKAWTAASIDDGNLNGVVGLYAGDGVKIAVKDLEIRK